MVYQRKKPIEHQVVESIIRGIVAIIKLPFRGLTKKSTSSIDRKEVEGRWREIEEIARSADNHQLAQAIIIADKLLDAVLTARGAQGQSMGERLKFAEKFFDNNSIYQGAWDAHKLRNQIAHEVDHVINSQQAQDAIEKLHKAIFSLI